MVKHNTFVLDLSCAILLLCFNTSILKKLTPQVTQSRRLDERRLATIWTATWLGLLDPLEGGLVTSYKWI